MAERAHLHAVPDSEAVVVDTRTGVAEPVCYGCVQSLKTIANQRREITELRKTLDGAVERRDPLDSQVMEVCTFHRRILSPTWRIVRKRGAYNDVRDRLKDVDAETGGPAFSVAHLRAASVGMWICDWTRDRNLRSASWLFGQTGHVQWMLDEAISFKRDTGSSALTLVDELGRPGLERLVERCECGHIRLEHEKERPELDLWDPPCAVHGCACVGWSESVDSRVWRWVAERGRMDAA